MDKIILDFKKYIILTEMFSGSIPFFIQLYVFHHYLQLYTITLNGVL